MRGSKKDKQYQYPEDTRKLVKRGYNDILFIFKCIDRVRVKKYNGINKREFTDLINANGVRVPYHSYMRYVRGYPKTDKEAMYLPNFFLIPNVLEPLNLTLQELFEQYGHD